MSHSSVVILELDPVDRHVELTAGVDVSSKAVTGPVWYVRAAAAVNRHREILRRPRRSGGRRTRQLVPSELKISACRGILGLPWGYTPGLHQRPLACSKA
jgi:hypothetical protein